MFTQAAIEAIPTVGEVLVSRVELPGQFGAQWRVTFLNSEWYQGGTYFDVPLLTVANFDNVPLANYGLTVTSAGGNGTFAGASAAVAVSRLAGAYAGYEQQSLTFSTANNGTLLGTFSIGAGPYSTPPLPINATNGAIGAALALLPSVGQVVVRTQLSSNGAQLLVVVVFVQALGGAVPVLVANTNGLTSSVHLAPRAINAAVATLVPGALPVLGSMYYNSTVVAVPAGADTQPVVATASGLVEGLAYYVRVSAWNGAGNVYGAAKPSFPVLTVASSAPRAVTDVGLMATSDTSLRVTWKPPASAGQGGAYPPSAYTVDYDLAPTAPEVQVVSLNASSAQISGTFCLAYGGHATGAIPYDAAASRLESAIESLASVGNVQVTQSFSQSQNRYGIAWAVTFVDNVGPLPLLSVACNDLAGSMVMINAYRQAAAAAPAFTGGSLGIYQQPLGTMTVQETATVLRIQVNASAADLNGYFTVVNGGEVSAPIDVYSSAAAVQTILTNMLTVADVTVTTVDRALQVRLPHLAPSPTASPRSPSPRSATYAYSTSTAPCRRAPPRSATAAPGT